MPNSMKKPYPALCTLKHVVVICILLLFIFITYNLKVTKNTRTMDLKVAYKQAEIVDATNYSHFDGVVFIVTFNSPFYNNIPLLKEMYGETFKEIFFCGPEPINGTIPKDLNLFKDQQQGIYGYMCMALAYKAKPNRKGYLYTNDDMIVNWWNLLQFDLNRIWQGNRVFHKKQNAMINKHDNWSWWYKRYGLIASRNFYLSLKNMTKNNGNEKRIATKALKKFLAYGKGQPIFSHYYSDFFYIPSKFAHDATALFDIAHQNNLFLELAVPSVTRMLDYEENFEHVDGYYFPEQKVNSYNIQSFWTHYNTKLTFVHPFKFNIMGSRAINKAIFKILIEISREKQKNL